MDLRELKFGIEIETVGKSRQTVAEAIRTVVGGAVRHASDTGSFDAWEVDACGRVWKVVHDASLTSVPAHLRAEVVSPILTYSDIPELQEVVRAVRKLAGARSSSECGIHVHFDSAPFDTQALVRLAKIVHKWEQLIIRALGLSGTRLQRYCKPMRAEFIRNIERHKPRTKDELSKFWYGFPNSNPVHYDQTRYHLLNLHSVWYRGTVEIRAFDGTLHAGRIKAYVQFCLAMAARAINARAASSRQREADGKSDKYTFRTLLLHLGLIGAEFKSCRTHLLANLAGSAAWKNGRPTPHTLATAPDTPPTAPDRREEEHPQSPSEGGDQQ
jgi:hypothetical protein